MIKNKFKIQDFTLLIVLLAFLKYQYESIIIGGTVWDDEGFITASKRIIEKALLYFNDPSNPFLSEFDFNLEFYGYLVAIPIYLISNSEFTISFFQNLIEMNPNINVKNFDELTNIIRFNLLNVYVISGLFLIYKLLNYFYEKTYSLLIVIFLLLIPSFSGHALFNIKDIPFAIQLFIATLYLLIVETKQSQINYSPNKQKFVKILLISFLLLVRFNGIVFIGLCSTYLLFLSKEKVKYLFDNAFVYVASLIIFFVGSPSSWQKPLLYFRETIKTQFFLDWPQATLTNGKYIYATEMESDYLVTWFFYKLPIVFHFGLIISLFLIIKYKKASPLVTYSLFYIFTINLVFIIFKPVSYDGLRQYIFLIPFFCIVLVDCIDYIKNKQIKVFTVSIFIFYLIFTQSNLGPYRYTYFNEFVQENKISSYCNEVGGCGDWATDYWGYSGKQLANKFNNLKVNEVLLCEPIRVFETYLHEEIKTLDLNEIPKQKEFYLMNIHRPMLSYDTCGFIDNSINYDCVFVDAVTTELRFNQINLSYIQKCELS